jgi:hypothetical protein
MNFATLRSLAIPEGNVTQITIGGVTVWVSSKPVKLQVKKITSDTYAGETTYTGEQFILLDIVPKAADSVVKVSYGGLTKTLTFSGTNTMPVYFGTFNGASDSVSTPESGALTISGDYNGFSTGSFQKGSKDYDIGRCGCITGVDDFGNLRELTNVSFASCTELTSIPWPNNITTIGNNTFNSCTGLTFSSLPSTITSIGNSAFRNCTGITLSSLPSSITTIGNDAFNGCTGVTFSSLPPNLTSISDYAFDGCTGVTFSSLSSKITSIGSYAFSGCTGITFSSLPSSIKSIGSFAFDGCTGITLTSLPSSLTSIESYAFSDCRNILITTIPSKVTTIGNKAFAMESSSARMYGKTVTVTLPASLKKVGEYILCAPYSASYGSLCNIKILATTPPSYTGDSNSSIFGTWRSGFKIIVPAGCGAAYKAAEGWSKYADYIEEG